MKKNCTLACILLGICALAFAVASVVCFVYGQYAPGGIGIAMLLLILWTFAGYVYRENIREHFIGRYHVRDYHGAKTILDKAARNHLLYPFMRIALNQMYLRIELCLDDIPAAVHYAESLRRLGGDGWRYKTAYFVTLFNLDWEDVAAARTEYEAFRAACSEHEIYRDQLAVLKVIFDHIDGRGGELPELVKNADYPILHRIVRRYC